MAGKTWWCAYDDGTVWPCEIVTTNYFYTLVRALEPAPDAGELRNVDPSRVYDSSFKRPTKEDIVG